MATVWSRPSSAASAAADAAAARSAPEADALSKAVTAGAKASTAVLSPRTAPPSSCIPESMAVRALATVCTAAGSSSPNALPARRMPVPSSGPNAPPVPLISAEPVARSTAPGVAGALVCTAVTAAARPRARFVPWSPSPIAESNSVKRSALPSTNRAASSSHRVATDVVNATSPPPTKRRCLHGCVPQPGELVVQRRHGDREAGLVQAGDVVADEATRERRAPCLDPGAGFGEAAIELDQRCGAGAVEQHEYVAFDALPGIDGLQRGSDAFSRWRQPPTFTARFAVDADPEFHRRGSEVETRSTHGRHRARE